MTTRSGERLSLGDALQLTLEALRAGCDVEILNTDSGCLVFADHKGAPWQRPKIIRTREELLCPVRIWKMFYDLETGIEYYATSPPSDDARDEETADSIAHDHGIRRDRIAIKIESRSE